MKLRVLVERVLEPVVQLSVWSLRINFRARSTQAVRMMVVPAVTPVPWAAGIQYSAWRISQLVGTPSNGMWSVPARVTDSRLSSRPPNDGSCDLHGLSSTGLL